MITNDILRQFIEDISNDENTFDIIGRAFCKIGEQYQIGELKAKLTAPATYCSAEAKDKEMILYMQECEEHEASDYHVEYQTPETGQVIFEITRIKNAPEFSTEEKSDIKMILDLIYMHCKKWKLASLVHGIGMIDSLTGLPNAGGFLTYIDGLMKKNELIQYSAFYFNLSRFGLINKRFGVKETDRIIARYATEVMSFLVEEEQLGRLGGDNFVALIRKERTQEFLSLIAGVKTYGILDGKKEQIVIGAVAGIMEMDDSIEDCGNVVNDCAMAMNIAKHVQRKPYAYASKEMKEKILRRNQMIAACPKAIQNREFKAFYQPKVSIDDYTMVGAEALVRWFQDDVFVSPGEFIPAFEQNDMVCQLDFYVLEQVCMDIREWLDQGMEPVRISVNFSRKHLTNKNLAEDIMNVINRYKIDSKYIEIELTETVDEEEAGLLIDFMNKMRKYSILMTIDDFGTGYSSLNMLRSFPVDVLKIDKSLVDNMEESDHIILSNVVKMASELKMDVVAEGVETWEQVDYLKTVKCSVVQGFLFDRPMPKEQFEEKIKSKTYKIG